MSVLKLIGLGLSRKLITEKTIEEIRDCDVVLFEKYTSLSCDIDVNFLQNLNKNIIEVDRRFLESNSSEITKLLSEKKRVCIVTIGDPIIATTHVSLVVEARSRGFEYKIVPAISVHCYIISKSMLSSYKFGKSVTITFPYSDKIDTTPYDVAYENFVRGLHTIMYLDLKEGKPMNVKDAIKLLNEMEKMKNKGLINNDRLIVVGQRLGCEDEEVIALKIGDALNYNFKEPPHIIVLPGDRLHFMEVEALKCLMR